MTWWQGALGALAIHAALAGLALGVCRTILMRKEDKHAEL